MPKPRTLDQWIANKDKALSPDDNPISDIGMLVSMKTSFDKSDVKIEKLERKNAINNILANNSGRTWEWYQQNAPHELEAMSVNNPDAFAQLYKAEYGVYPECSKSNTTHNIEKTKTESNRVVKNWEWYQQNAPHELEAMSQTNPTAFAELYKTEYGCYPKGNQFNNK